MIKSLWHWQDIVTNRHADKKSQDTPEFHSKDRKHNKTATIILQELFIYHIIHEVRRDVTGSQLVHLNYT